MSRTRTVHRMGEPRVRKPAWLKVAPRAGAEYFAVRRLVRDHGLHTICSEARCPNQSECWNARTATLTWGKDETTVRKDVRSAGFEYEIAEVGSGTTKTQGNVVLDLKNSYGQFARLHLNNNGVIRHRTV